MTVDEHDAPPEPVVAHGADPAAGSPPAGVQVDVQGLPDTALRSALEFAVGIAAAGQKLRPPLVFPQAMRPHLRLARLDRPALSAVRRAVAADDAFRTRLGEVATAELVDELGITWLQRSEGWVDRIGELLRAAKQQADESVAEAALRKSERRREAAEQVAARANAELLGHQDAIAREQLRRDKAEDALATAGAEVASLRTELTGLRREVDRLRQRTDAEHARADRAEAATADITAQLRVVEALRDEILATRAGMGPAASPREVASAPAPAVEAAHTNRVAARALHQAAAATRDLAAALGAAGEALSSGASPAAPAAFATAMSGTGSGVAPVRPIRPRVQQRRPIAIPGGVYGDSLAAAAHLLRTPQVVLVVDGYNVAKLAWPNLELIDQRERCIDLLEDIARRHGTEIRVVFDGADIVGASAGRRLIRVQYSPAGVIADDVIRAEVRALPPTTPVVVATNDQAIVSDVRTEGANVIASEMLLAVGGRPLR